MYGALLTWISIPPGQVDHVAETQEDNLARAESQDNRRKRKKTTVIVEPETMIADDTIADDVDGPVIDETPAEPVGVELEAAVPSLSPSVTLDLTARDIAAIDSIFDVEVKSRIAHSARALAGDADAEESMLNMAIDLCNVMRPFSVRGDGTFFFCRSVAYAKMGNDESYQQIRHDITKEVIESKQLYEGFMEVPVDTWLAKMTLDHEWGDGICCSAYVGCVHVLQRLRPTPSDVSTEGCTQG